LPHGDTHLVLKPDSDFFRYFSDPLGQQAPQAQAPKAAASTPATPGSK
jgi:modulator of FtsH protease HflC